MGTYTKGPWEIREVAHEATPLNKRRVYRVEIVSPQFYMGKKIASRHICQIIDYCEWADHPANARLITAAPDLLDALRNLVTRWPNMLGEDEIAPAVAAIAKAEGTAQKPDRETK